MISYKKYKKDTGHTGNRCLPVLRSPVPAFLPVLALLPVLSGVVIFYIYLFIYKYIFSFFFSSLTTNYLTTLTTSTWLK